MQEDSHTQRIYKKNEAHCTHRPPRYWGEKTEYQIDNVFAPYWWGYRRNGNYGAFQNYWILNRYEPLLLYKASIDVWNKVATDLSVFRSKLYLFIIDYTSKYIKLVQTVDASSDMVISHVRSIFAWHGKPKVVFSDQRSQYSFHKLKKISKSWDFIHKTSSTGFPHSNGFVEKAIQTINKTLWTCREGNSDPYLSMLPLCTTKNSSGLHHSCWRKQSCKN